MNKVYLVTWVDENDACVRAYATPQLALYSLFTEYGKEVFNANGELITSWDGKQDLDIYLAPQSDRNYQLQTVTWD